MKRLILLILLIQFGVDLYSQNYLFKLYTSPLQAIDFISHPMVSLGGELIVLKRWGIAGEYGYKYTDNSKADTVALNSEGNSYRFELKFYDIVKSKKGFIRNYVSLEYRYIKDNYNYAFSYHPNSTSTEKIEDNFGVLKNIYTGNIKYGIIIGIGKRFYTDVYGGIGIRYRDVKNTKREYDPKSGHEHAYPDDIFSDYNLDEKSGFYPNLSLGLKVGIRF
jgi:hypothetical protein